MGGKAYVLYEGDTCVGAFGSYREIAERLGVSPVAVYQYATDAAKEHVRRHRRNWKRTRTVWREEVA